MDPGCRRGTAVPMTRCRRGAGSGVGPPGGLIISARNLEGRSHVSGFWLGRQVRSAVNLVWIAVAQSDVLAKRVSGRVEVGPDKRVASKIRNDSVPEAEFNSNYCSCSY